MRDFRSLSLGEGLVAGLPRSFSGQDFKAWAYYPSSLFTDTPERAFDLVDLPESLRDGQRMLGELHTISTPFAASLSPVVRIGESMPVAHTRGQKTFAGSMVFTVFNQDPLKELVFSSDYGDARSELFTIDQIPPFNILIQGDHEYAPQRGEVKTSIYKLMVGVQFASHGETITIDDFYLEQSYQYRCRYVSQWMTGTVDYETINQTVPNPTPTGVTKSAVSQMTDEEAIMANINGSLRDAEAHRRLMAIGHGLDLNINEVQVSPVETISYSFGDGEEEGSVVRSVR